MGDQEEISKVVAGKERCYVSPNFIREAWGRGHTILESEFSAAMEGCSHQQAQRGLHCQSPLASSHQPEAVILSPHGGRGPTGEWPANLTGDEDGGRG